VRHVGERAVKKPVDDRTAGRLPGMFGEPHVNVLALDTAEGAK
jgi:K+-transporting ATPase c subunit